MLVITRPRCREEMVGRVTAAARQPLADRHRAVSVALADFVGDRDLLAGVECPALADRYTRHLLHDDPGGGFAIAAIVWMPGQMSPIHAHKTWCALGIHDGTMVQSFYSVEAGAEDGTGDGLPQLTGAQLCPVGTCCGSAADPDSIHRLANLGARTAISIHVYGVAFERFGRDVNLVRAS